MSDDSNSLVLRPNDSGRLDKALLEEWKTQLEGQGADVSKAVLDLSQISDVSDIEVVEMSRAMSRFRKESGWTFSVICPGSVETIFSRNGLDSLFPCYQVHQKAIPSKDVLPAEMGAGVLRMELSSFFGYLVTALERISGVLFNDALKYQAPLKLLTEIGGSCRIDSEIIVVRVESAAMVYRLCFLMSQGHKQMLAKAAFNGKTVKNEVVRDLVAELANNILGEMTAQLSRLESPVKLSVEIPDILENMEPLPEADTEQMKGKAMLKFVGQLAVLDLLVGYKLR